VPWRGGVWRFHNRRYPGGDPGGSLKVSGRYNLGLDEVGADRAFAALYCGLTQAICMGEILRHLTPATFERLGLYRLTELYVEAGAVLDCREPSVVGLTREDLLDDLDYTVPRQLAAAAFDVGAEGILVPSATNLGDNLVLFTEKRRRGSLLIVTNSVDPQIYVNRAGVV
jgi:RES domain-containing protein